MTVKKAIALILSVFLIFSVAGCQKNPQSTASEGQISESKETAADSISLLYSASDTFNPYTAETDLNRNLCRLLFDSLIKLNNNFEAEYIIADTVTVKKKTCTVTLKDVRFSDGTALTADDVVYSCRLALKSKSSYKDKLYEVKSVRAEDSRTVVFSLSRYDAFFERLIDFPIIKAKSDTKTDKDGILITPIGSGRYKLSENNSSFIYNKEYFGAKANIKSIELVNAPDPESVAHYVEIGATDIYYTDVTGGSIVRMSGKKTDVNLNNLVYIGINDSNPLLKNKEIRYAISSAIDRSAVCQAAYHNNAIAATGFFNPVISDISSVQNLGNTANTEISIENLEEIGYNKLNSENLRVNASGKGIKLTLLVNKDNSSRVAAADLISASLKAVGIEITVVKRSFKEYLKALKSGSFQLYLGEVEMLANMDIENLVVAGGSCAYGISEKKKDKKTDSKDKENGKKQDGEEISAYTIADIIDGFYSGKNTITDVANILQTEMPVIPVCFRKGLLFYSDAVKNADKASAGDIYSGL